MKKILFILLFSFFASNCFAERITLQNSDGVEIGTAANPIYTSINGSDLTVGNLTATGAITTSGADERITGSTYGEFIDFNDGGDGYLTFGGNSSNSTIKFLNSNIPAIYSSGGNLTIGGIGLTNNEALLFNFESTANRVDLSSTTGAFLNFLIDTNFAFGGKAYMRLSSQGNDSFQLGLTCNSTTGSGYFSIMEDNDIGHANRTPLVVSVNPVYRIYSSNQSSATDYIEFYHDQTNANISVGLGNLNINTARVITNTIQLSLNTTTPTNGTLMYNDTSKIVYVYNGTAWDPLNE